MNTPFPPMRIAAVCALALSSMAFVCTDSLSPPPGGGRRHESRECQGQGDNEWAGDQLTVVMNQPPCPYSLSVAGSIMDFAFTLQGPETHVMNGAFVNTNIFNITDALVGGTDGETEFVDFDGSNVEAQPSGTWTGGTGSPVRDSAAFEVTGTVDGVTANGGFNAPGDISGSSDVIGAANVVVGTSTWRAQSDWDTTMYTFNWFVDGSLASSHATIARTFSLAGTHAMRVVTTLGDRKADTTNFTAFVAPTSSISGKSTIQTVGTYTWTATPSGCNTTCTYQWQELPEVTGGAWANTSGTTTHSQNVQASSPSFQLRVITTSQGQSSTSGTFEVNNLSGGTGCNPDCAKVIRPRVAQLRP